MGNLMKFQRHDHIQKINDKLNKGKKKKYTHCLTNTHAQLDNTYKCTYSTLHAPNYKCMCTCTLWP